MIATGFAALVIIAIASIVRALLKAVVEMLVHLFLGLCLALLGGLALAVAAASGGHDPVVTGIVAAFLLAAPATYAVWQLRQRPALPVIAPAPPGTMKQTDPLQSVEEQFGLRDDAALGEAWDKAMALAPSCALAASRTSVARFLAAMQATPALDCAAIEHATFVRRQLPAMVGDVSAALVHAGAVERERRIKDMVGDLVDLGCLTEERRAALGEGARDQLAIRRARWRMHVRKEDQRL